MPCPHELRPRPRGAGLLEVVLVVALVAALCLLALPSLAGSVAAWRADMLRMRLVSALNSARATAITGHQPILLCPSDDGSACGSDWARGWLLQPAPAGGAGPLPGQRRFQPGTDSARISAHSSQGRRQMRFQADGRSGGSTLTIRICSGDRLHSEVIVNNVGRTRSTRQKTPAACSP